MPPSSVRDRLTWVVYGMLAWFAYLQAAPGLVVAHLRDELGLSYAVGGLHVAAFAAGEHGRGRDLGDAGARARTADAVLVCRRGDGCGGRGLTAGRVAAVTIGAVLVMGFGGGLAARDGPGRTGRPPR